MRTLIVGVIVSIIVIVVVRFFVLDRTFRKRNDLSKKLTRYNDTWNEQIYAYTYDKLPDGSFKNYYSVDDSSRTEIFPVDPKTANPISSENDSDNHGKITYYEDGFKIEGIGTKFTCPTPNFVWNADLKKCVAKNVCEKPGLKGLTKYELFPWHPTAAGSGGVHPKVYVKCDKNLNSELKYCPEYTEFSDTLKKCVQYNLCEDVVNSDYVHGIDGRKRYKKCQEGKLVEVECENKLVFSNKYKTCVDRSTLLTPCELGETFYRDKRSYFTCVADNKRKIIRCGNVNKVITLKNGKHKCQNKACIMPHYFTYFTNKHFNLIPMGGYICGDDDEIKSTKRCNYTLQAIRSLNEISKSKFNFYDENIHRPSVMFEYDANYQDGHCVSNYDWKKYAINKYVNCSYIQLKDGVVFGNYYWNFVDDIPKDIQDGQYYLKDGTIYQYRKKTGTSEKIRLLTSDDIPFHISDQIRKDKHHEDEDYRRYVIDEMLIYKTDNSKPESSNIILGLLTKVFGEFDEYFKFNIVHSKNISTDELSEETIQIATSILLDDFIKTDGDGNIIHDIDEVPYDDRLNWFTVDLSGKFTNRFVLYWMRYLNKIPTLEDLTNKTIIMNEARFKEYLNLTEKMNAL